MSWATLKADIAAVIKTNGTNAITGAILQNALNNKIIAQLGALQFKGMAVPATNPGTPDGEVFYLTAYAGTYTNFGGAVIPAAGLHALMWNGATWTALNLLDLSVFEWDLIMSGNQIKELADGVLDDEAATVGQMNIAIAAAISGGFAFKGSYDAATNTPDLDTAPTGVVAGDIYVVSVAGTFFTAAVEIGDTLLAKQDDADAEAEWVILQGNINYTAAQIKSLYESNSDTNAFTDAEQTKLSGIATNANNYAHPNHSGDVTSSGDGATTIAAAAISGKTENTAPVGTEFALILDGATLKKIAIQAIADLAGSGDLDLDANNVYETGVAGETLSTGNIVYLKNDGKYWKASNAALATGSPALRMSLGDYVAGDPGTFLKSGKRTTTGLTAGAVYYLGTAGAITATEPTTVGVVKRVIGTAKSTTVFMVDISPFYTVVAASGGLGNVVEDTTPQLGGQLDLNDFSLLLNEPSASYKYNGLVRRATITTLTSAEIGVLLYWNGAEEWYEEADAASGLQCSAISATPNDNGQYDVVLQGFLRYESWTFTQGAVLYLGNGGAISETPGAVEQIIGRAIYNSIIYFDPQPPADTFTIGSSIALAEVSSDNSELGNAITAYRTGDADPAVLPTDAIMFQIIGYYAPLHPTYAQYFKFTVRKGTSSPRFLWEDVPAGAYLMRLEDGEVQFGDERFGGMKDVSVLTLVKGAYKLSLTVPTLSANVDHVLPATAGSTGNLLYKASGGWSWLTNKEGYLRMSSNVPDYSMIIYNTEAWITADGGGFTLTWANGNVRRISMTADDNVTFSWAAGSTQIVLIVAQDGTGGHDLTFNDTIIWTGGSAPTLDTAANAYNVILLTCDGTNFYGHLLEVGGGTPSVEEFTETLANSSATTIADTASSEIDLGVSDDQFIIDSLIIYSSTAGTDVDVIFDLEIYQKEDGDLTAADTSHDIQSALNLIYREDGITLHNTKINNASHEAAGQSTLTVDDSTNLAKYDLVFMLDGADTDNYYRISSVTSATEIVIFDDLVAQKDDNSDIFQCYQKRNLGMFVNKSSENNLYVRITNRSTASRDFVAHVKTTRLA